MTQSKLVFEKTFERLRALIENEHHLDVSTLTPTSILTEIGLDSLSIAELLFSIEDSFKINLGSVSPEAIPVTLKDLVDLIEAHSQ